MRLAPKKYGLKSFRLKRLAIITTSLIIMMVVTAYYEPVDPEFTRYTPILMERTTLESSIKLHSTQALKKPGKIYIYNNLLLVNEKYKGVHIFDNTNPTSPVNKGFIRIPGNIDIAVKDKILYADNAVDLVAIDINDINNLGVTSRTKNIFPELTPPDIEFIPYEYEKGNRPENTVIVEWKLKSN